MASSSARFGSADHCHARRRGRGHFVDRLVLREGLTLSHGLHTASANTDVTVDVNAHQEAKADEDRQHRRAAVGYQRQRHADDWNQASHHSDIAEDVEEECRGNAEPKQSRELAARAPGDCQSVNDEERIEPKQTQGANQSKLLGQHREYEIGLLFRQKIQMGSACRPGSPCP